jgi:hypothetical protein
MDIGYTCTVVKEHAYASTADACRLHLTPVQWLKIKVEGFE